MKRHVLTWLVLASICVLSAKAASVTIDVAPPGKQGARVFFRHGKKCILRGRGLGEALRVRIFRGTPTELAKRVPPAGAACVEISSIAGIVVPDGADLDLQFYFTVGWLKRIDKRYTNGQFSFVLERVPQLKKPQFVEFREEKLRIPANQVANYFASAIHVTVQAPDNLPRKKKRRWTGPVMPKAPDPHLVKAQVVECNVVTYTRPVTLQVRSSNAPSHNTVFRAQASDVGSHAPALPRGGLTSR